MISNKYLLVVVLWLIYIATYGQADRVKDERVPGVIKKMADLADKGVDLLTFEKEKYTFFILPLVAYEERSQLELGIMPVWRFYMGGNKEIAKYDRPSNISPYIRYSTSGMYALNITSNFYTKNDWYIRNKWIYEWMPDKFYSIGNWEDKELYAEMEVKSLQFRGEVMKGLTREFYAGINYDIGLFDVKVVGGSVLNNGVLGYDGGDVLGLGPMLRYDDRNSIVFPDKGSFASLSYMHYPKVWGDYSFSTVTLDVRRFISLTKKDRVLASQFYLKSAHGNVPFFRLPVLGGKKLLRGISHPYKYMDKNSVYMQTAYRSPLWWRLGYEVFTGVGNISEKWDASIWKNIHVMLGAGLRVKVIEKEKLNFRFDYGISSGGNSGFFFTLGEAF
ncbi:BamA/TamA family outer membrane protein [Saccharicrinis fermentans]|uniref:Outer membrane protein/protective antigen OMA87 n=1 Tax=Saccharicrinis fermentans DSM 9555 = JCM 21142 TaxID=869213 RepID=W7Y834_9BACT|nr:BamA/TamA family outer membrane protein [Saccharicrinis fermentans]GAF03838.1 outer membrane protein/protective antigen OMA87 [Saccharicrinis fermentans DSM 9555 = JCM 21142]